MALILRICILGACFLFAFSPATLWGKEIRTVRVAAFNYYPAIFLDTDNKVRGFYVDMLDELASREQVRFEYVFGSWNDGLERLRSGDVDLVTSAAYTEERSTFMDFGKQVLLPVWGELYIHKDSPTIPLRELQDKNIAVMRGDYNARSFSEHLGKFGISSQFIEFADFEEVFEAVKERRVIGGVVNSVFGDAAAKKYEVQSSGIAFNPFDIYFAVAKGQNADLLMLLDEYLFDWRNDSSSVYYQSRLKWGAVHEHEEFIPDWMIKLAVGAVLLLLIGLVFIVLLRHRVHTATRQLQDSNNLIRLLLDSTAEAIYGLDPHGICTFCNAACVRILGYENATQLIGQNMHDLVHPSHADGRGRPDNECNLLKELNRRIHSDNEVFWRADGSNFPVEYWSHPIRQGDKTLGLVISFVDITERKQKEKALKQAELALKQYNEEMEQFVYSVSHDLKSPLITVRTFLAMLRQDLLGCDQQQINEDINYIDKAAEKMSQLLEALLKYSQVDRKDAPAQTMSVSQQVEECLTSLAGVLQKDQVQVSISELPHQLHGDPLHFGQIWQNLIENAVKYMGDQAYPHIEIGATQQEHDAVFYVRDNGMGIAPEHSGHIFNLFSKLNQSSEGSGLGLALAKKIVSIYQGRIWVESTGNEQGSCFCFTLPAALIQETRHPDAVTDQSS